MNKLNSKELIHNCYEHRVYLDPCEDCKKADKKCDLSAYGICSVCGRILNDKN